MSPIDAIALGDTDHEPPAGMAVTVVVVPTHTASGLIVREGTILTVILTDEEHPAVLVYDMAQVPTDKPVINPPETVATLELLLLHVPPETPVTNSVIVAPAHNVVGPVIKMGGSITTVAAPVILAVQPEAVVATTV